MKNLLSLCALGIFCQVSLGNGTITVVAIAAVLTAAAIRVMKCAYKRTSKESVKHLIELFLND